MTINCRVKIAKSGQVSSEQQKAILDKIDEELFEEVSEKVGEKLSKETKVENATKKMESLKTRMADVLKSENFYSHIRSKMGEAAVTQNLTNALNAKLKYKMGVKKYNAAVQNGTIDKELEKFIGGLSDREFVDQAVNSIEGVRGIVNGITNKQETRIATAWRDLTLDLQDSLGKDYKIIESNIFGRDSGKTKAFMEDVRRELYQVNTENGKVGITQNELAGKVAKTLQKNLKKNVDELEKAKIPINDFEGWAGKQKEDKDYLKSVGFDKWFNDIKSRLDVEKMFEKAPTDEELNKVMRQIYNTKINNFENKAIDYNVLQERRLKQVLFGKHKQIKGAKSATGGRVMFFKNIEDEIWYNDNYNGGENIVSQVYGLVSTYQKLLTQTDFGDNSGVTFANSINNLATKYGKQLNLSVKTDAASGITSLTGHGEAARIAKAYHFAFGFDKVGQGTALENAVRKAAYFGKTWQYVTKMGRMFLTYTSEPAQAAYARTFIGDSFTKAAAQGYWRQAKSLFNTLTGVVNDELSHEVKMQLYAHGVGLHQFQKEMTHNFIVNNKGQNVMDSISNAFSSLAFHNAGTQMSEYMALGSSAYIGKSIKKAKTFTDLNPKLKSKLERFGVNENDFKAFQKMLEHDNVENYFLTKNAQYLSDIELKDIYGKDIKDYDALRKQIEQKGQEFFNDQFSGMLNYQSAKTRRQMALARDSNDVAKNVFNLATQFQSWSWENFNNIFKRSIYDPDLTGAEKALNVSKFIPALLLATYASFALKAISQNLTPPQLIDDDGNINYDVLWDVTSFSGLPTIIGDNFSKFFKMGKARYDPDKSLGEHLSGPAGDNAFGFLNAVWMYGDAIYNNNDDKLNKANLKMAKWTAGNVPGNNIFYLQALMEAGKELTGVDPMNEISRGLSQQRKKDMMRKKGQRKLIDLE